MKTNNEDVSYYPWSRLNNDDFPALVVQTDVKGRVPRHSHDFHELVVFLHGSSVHEIWGKDGSCTRYGVTQGDVLAVRQNEEHAYENGSEARFCNLIFRSDIILAELESLQQFPLWNTFFGEQKSEMRGKCHLGPVALAEVRKYIQRMERETELKAPGCRLVLKNTFLEILTLILRSPQQRLFKSDSSDLDLQMLKCLGRIEDRPEHSFSLADCARQANMCVASFSRKFRQMTDMSFKEYLLRQRLKKAETMLLLGNEKLDEIADACGFYDANYFIKIFKRAYQVSPARYRRAGRSGE